MTLQIPCTVSPRLRTCAAAVLIAAVAPPALAAPAPPDDAAIHRARVTTIWAFLPSDGSQPVGALLAGSDGSLYGATEFGGGRTESGAIFRISPKPHRFKQLHAFAGDDGAHPLGSLVEGADGWLYGTTSGGGAVAGCEDCGTIFRISMADGSFEIVHRFAGGVTDGRNPSSGLVIASDGNLYGATRAGGEHDAGTVYRLAADGSVTVIRSFTHQGPGASAGVHPGPLIQAADGLLHGTAEMGGSPRHCSKAGGCGAVFRMTLAGEVVDHTPMRDELGQAPRSGLAQATDGDDYGTAFAGGPDDACADGCGTIFRVRASDGHASRVHAFDGGHGWGPDAPPLQGADGFLYGTTRFGGATKFKRKGCGTIWRLSPEGDFQTLYDFKCLRDGEAPTGGLIQGPDGALYGTALHGGNGATGLVYRVDP
jgi:uncharacterized repeat protein (TIGR03803 family)